MLAAIVEPVLTGGGRETYGAVALNCRPSFFLLVMNVLDQHFAGLLVWNCTITATS